MTSCIKSSLEKEEYINWVEDSENGLLVEHTNKNCLFRLQYKPSAYLILKENKNVALNIESYNKTIEEVGNLYYFNFSISSISSNKDVLKEGISDEQAYTKRLNYFSYEAQEDLKLIRGKDTLSCVLYHFERSYGLSPYNTLVLGFEKGKNSDIIELKDDLIFSFDNHLFGISQIIIRIKAKDINGAPRLKIS